MVGFTEEFTQEQSIEVREPKKFRFFRRRPSGRYAGGCGDSQKIEIAVNRHDLARDSILMEDVLEMLDTGLHEFVHALRFERFPAERHGFADYPEHAIHEGLAYTGGLFDLQTGEMSGSSILALAQKVYAFDRRLALPCEELGAVPQKFADITKQLLASTGKSNDFYYWRRSRPRDNDLSETVGIIAVATLLDAGSTFADLLDYPAEQVLESALDAVRG